MRFILLILLLGLCPGIGFLIFSGCEKKQAEVQREVPQKKYEGIIAAVGDSLTEGYGVEEEEAYPALLEKKLHENGFDFQVINAGISGETSTGTRSRINWILNMKPDIVILETGANDGLRGIDPALIQKNIDETVQILKENRVVVILAGMRMVRNLGKEYTEKFAGVYHSVAEKHGIGLIPFFLKGVAGEPGLNQADGIHPTAPGYEIITETVYEHAAEAIRQWRSKKERGNAAGNSP
ncbi:MAG: arylesterase [Desulfococcaceae bacterium]